MEDTLLLEYPYYQTLIEETKSMEDNMGENLQFYFNTKTNEKNHPFYKTDFFLYCQAYCLFPTEEIKEGFRKKGVQDELLNFFIDVKEIIKSIEILAATKGILIPDKNLLLILVAGHISAKINYYSLIYLGLFHSTKRLRKKGYKRKLDYKAAADNFTRRIENNPSTNMKPLEHILALTTNISSKNMEGAAAIIAEIIPNNTEDNSKDSAFIDTLWGAPLLVIKEAGKENEDAAEVYKTLNKVLEGKNSFPFDKLIIGYNPSLISQRQFHIALYPFFMSFCKDDERLITKEDFDEKIAPYKDSMNNFDEYREQKILAILGKTKG